MTRHAILPIALFSLCLAFAFSQPFSAEAQVLKDLGKAIENTGKGIKETGKFIGDGVKKTGEAIEDGVKSTGEALSGDNAEDEAAATDSADGEAEGEVAAGEVPTPQQKPVQKSYLFVQQAGSLTYTNGKLMLADLSPSTLFFTDRPERKAGSMTNAAFAALWNEDSGNGFKTDPPNAAITIAGDETVDPVVVELLSAELSGSDLIYSVRAVSGELPADAKDVALFVDLD